MSKKKRNPRAIREISKTVKNSPIYKIEKGDKVSEVVEKKVEISPSVLLDLKKVTFIILSMVALLLVLAYLSYKTELFAPIFNVLKVSY